MRETNLVLLVHTDEPLDYVVLLQLIRVINHMRRVDIVDVSELIVNLGH